MDRFQRSKPLAGARTSPIHVRRGWEDFRTKGGRLRAEYEFFTTGATPRS
jgi:hypothetical protein